MNGLILCAVCFLLWVTFTVSGISSRVHGMHTYVQYSKLRPELRSIMSLSASSGFCLTFDFSLSRCYDI
jgi:hypothetical protein